MPNICKVEGCTEPVHAIGMCQNHYRQHRRELRGLSKPGPKPDPSKPRSRYRDRDICPNGHPLEGENLQIDSRGHRLCRACLEERRKTHCPQGHEYTEENTYVDSNGGRHCRSCQRETMKDRRPRTTGQGGHNAAKTHCKHGHEYTPDNTAWTPDGRRQCRTCARLNGQVQNLKRYGLTKDRYEEMFQAQEGRCPICHSELVLGEGTTHIDHDHSCCPGPYSCGRCVRALLCDNCNPGLGYFKDDPALLRAAADYLEVVHTLDG